jgi:ferrous iron transport protein B
VLELPPYRRPRWGQLLVRSVLDRTLKILGRAVLVSAPAGAILWLVSHLQIGGVPIVRYLTDALQTPGRLLGVDGVVLTALLLSFPANELFLPLVMMLYRGSGVMEPLGAYTELYALLSRMGWGPVTAICTLLLVMFHAPCATTLVTLYKESRSSLFTVAAALLPLAVGVVLCFILASLLG